MINEASVKAVRAARWGKEGRFTRPLPGGYSFDQLSRLVQSLFSGDDREIQERLIGPFAGRYKRVVLLFVDAFGWRFLNHYAERYPFLWRFFDEGCVTALTSQFPSTTTAHITTIHTGMPVGQSGLYEWYIYEPKVDRVIMPLPFAFAGSEKRSLMGTLEPSDLLPHLRETLYERLSSLGVRGTVLGHRSYTPSHYGNVVLRGARQVPYETLDEGFTHLAARVRSATEPAYFSLYSGDIDAAGHDKGPLSDRFDREVDLYMTRAERLVSDLARAGGGETLLLVTADHGQTEVSPQRMVLLDRELPDIIPHMKTTREGRPIAPTGAPRDMFLHIKDGHMEDAEALLAPALEGHAEIYRRDALIEEGFFGPEPPSEQFMARVGDLVILPYEGEQVWWWGENGESVLNFYGHHGGLTPHEMETILLAMVV
jgi:hypothetical protein